MKLSNDDIKHIIDEYDAEIETEHRKGSTFFANAFLEITQDIAACFLEDRGIDISELIGTAVTANGIWSDEWGTDWYSFGQLKKKITHVPEETKIIPAHNVITWVDIDKKI